MMIYTPPTKSSTWQRFLRWLARKEIDTAVAAATYELQQKLAQPLVWTTRGNMPQRMLTAFAHHTFQEDGSVVYVHGYTMDGENVRQDVTLLPRGIQINLMGQ